MNTCHVFCRTVKTSAGKFQVWANERGVVKINFPNRHHHEAGHVRVSSGSIQAFKRAESFLKDYFSNGGMRLKRGMPHVPIDWQIFRPFERRVLKQLMRVPPGKATSYGALARRSGCPDGARAVGNVLKRNPIPVLLPCHRVVRSDSKIGGFQHGIRWKMNLLKREQQMRQEKLDIKKNCGTR